MCGIAGSTRTETAVLAAMLSRLRHRGPDSQGVDLEHEGGPGFCHTRLAVIDLSAAGAQPMASACGRWLLVYNGEIYNYRTLRASLEASGHTFCSGSDTEVLLSLLAREGTACLSRLAGMFAFALWDRERKELLLVRDRLGVKPLVYAPLGDGQLAFASEIRALEVHPGVDLTLDREALSDYLACLYVPAPATLYRGIRKLPPGHLLRWRNGRFGIERYWSPAVAGTRSPDFAEAVEELTPLVRQAVVERMVADVPVGCFLSGGIDSSVIAAVMADEAARLGAPRIRTFTMTFTDGAYDERGAAADVAARVGSVHAELPASADLVSLMDDCLVAFGEPFGNPTALLVHDLSRKAREHVTVALVGDGGDEVFAGYPRYHGGRLARQYRRLPGWLREGIIAPAAGLIPESSKGRHGWRRAREFLAGANLPDDAMYASWVEYFDPEERRALLGSDSPPRRPIAEAYGTTPSRDVLDAMQQTDLLTFLPGNILAYGDAMSMRHALELRHPLLDHRLLEAVQTVASGVRFQGGLKALLKGVARRFLPEEVIRRPKRGFNPPMGVWLKRELAPLVAERLTPDTLAAMGLAWAPVERMLAEHRQGRRDHALKIWALIVLDAWYRRR